MAFQNSFELKFSNIVSTPSKTVVDVWIYKVSDGGFDSFGNPIFNRIPFQPPVGRPQINYPLEFVLDAGWDKPRLIAYFKSLIANYNSQLSLGYAQANQLCTL